MSHALTTLCCNRFQGNNWAAADDNIPNYNRCSVIVILKKKGSGMSCGDFFICDLPSFHIPQQRAPAHILNTPRCAHSCLRLPFFSPLSQQGQQRSGHKQSLANTRVILVCHLSQVINTDHGLIKTCVVTVRALQPINALGHLFFSSLRWF